MLRVHDVAENRAALAVFMALKAPPRRPFARSPRTTAERAIVLALGGNVGDKARSLRRALRAIASEPGIELTAVSRFYRTAPWGKTDQDWFVNACALGRTSLKPEALLERMKGSRSSSAARLRSDGGRASSTSTSSPTATLPSRPNG